MIGYKTSLFKIFTPKWLCIRPYGDFVQGLITSLPCSISQIIFKLKKTIIRLEDEAKVKDSSIAAYQTQNSLLNEEILELNGRIKCDGMPQSINRK